MKTELIARFAAIVGPAHAITDQQALAPHLIETRGLYHGASPLLLKPANTAEVSAILSLANETGTVIVPQSGNTGHAGGQTPREGQEDVLLSLQRLNTVREVDLLGEHDDSRCRLHSRQPAHGCRGA